MSSFDTTPCVDFSVRQIQKKKKKIFFFLTSVCGIQANDYTCDELIPPQLRSGITNVQTHILVFYFIFKF